MDSLNEMIIRSLFRDSDVFIKEGFSFSSILEFAEEAIISVIACVLIYKIIKWFRK